MSLRRGRARLAAPSLALALLVPACRGDEPAGDTMDSGSGTEDEGPLRPTFSEPASDRLSLRSTRNEDVTLAVEGVTLGHTDLVLDGRSFGPLGEGNRHGQLGPDSLQLRVRGSMLSGQHTMFLRTLDATGQAESETITIDITADLAPVPVATGTEPAGTSADRLLASGEGDDAVLLAFESTNEGPRLHLIPRGDVGWDPSGMRTVSTPGLVPDPEQRALQITALRYDQTDDHKGRLRVAWRVGSTGSRIDILDIAWDAADPTVAPRTSLTADDALDGRAAEWAALGRPWLVADLLLVELYAPLDVEAPRPGDRTLVWSRVHENATALDRPQRVSVRADLVDIDSLGPAVDRIAREVGAPPLVSVRVDQHQPLLLEVDPAGGLRARATEVDGRDRSFSFVDIPLVTITGAFGSRTVAGLTARSNSRMRVALIDDLGDGGVIEHSLSNNDLPDFDGVSGEMAVGSVGGLSVFLLPYGRDTPVQAVHTAGNSVRVTALDDLHCDSITLASFAVGDGELPLACAIDGQLHLGSLGFIEQT